MCRMEQFESNRLKYGLIKNFVAPEIFELRWLNVHVCAVLFDDNAQQHMHWQWRIMYKLRTWGGGESVTYHKAWNAFTPS